MVSSQNIIDTSDYPILYSINNDTCICFSIEQGRVLIKVNEQLNEQIEINGNLNLEINDYVKKISLQTSIIENQDCEMNNLKSVVIKKGEINDNLKSVNKNLIKQIQNNKTKTVLISIFIVIISVGTTLIVA